MTKPIEQTVASPTHFIVSDGTAEESNVGPATIETMVGLLGLGTAAMTAASDYATAVQGAKSDTAIQSADLGSAAFLSASSFADSTQGSLAASAVQPGDLATVATSGDYDDLTNKPTLGTAASASTSDFATAAQGDLADSALQDDDIGTAALEDVEAFAAAVHSHAISDVTGLQDALDAKATSSDIDNALAAKFVEISEEDYDLLDPPTPGVWYGVPL